MTMCHEIAFADVFLYAQVIPDVIPVYSVYLLTDINSTGEPVTSTKVYT